MADWFDTRIDGDIYYAADHNAQVAFLRMLYSEGVLAAPTIAYVDDTHISVTSVDVLIRSDAVFGADGVLLRKTVAQNTNLAVTGGGVVNYVYVTYNSGTPIYAVTTSRNDLNMSDALPVARVSMGTGSISYQISYGVVGKGGVAKNIDRVLRIRGSGGLEIESGLTLTETATRVINIGSGFVWFGLRRITDTDLPAIVQTDGDVTSHLWYHEATTGNWVSTPVTAYNNTQYDDAVAPYAGLQTLTNTSRYAVNWVFRNVTTKEIDIVLGTGDYTLSQAEASTIPTLPPEIAAFYVLCGRIIVQKSSDTAYAIENIVNNTFRVTTTTVHSELSNLGYADAGHTGFTPSVQYDYIKLDPSGCVSCVTNEAPINVDETATNKINYSYGLFTQAGDGVNRMNWREIFKADWKTDGNIEVKFFWMVMAGTAGHKVKFEIFGKQLADGDTLDSALVSIGSAEDAIIAVGDVHVTTLTTAAAISGTAGSVGFFEIQRIASAATETTEDIRLLGASIKYIRTVV